VQQHLRNKLVQCPCVSVKSYGAHKRVIDALRSESAPLRYAREPPIVPRNRSRK